MSEGGRREGSPGGGPPWSVAGTGSRHGRRRYVRIRHEALGPLRIELPHPEVPVLFGCIHHSVRSQLAAALWSRELGGAASSAGTHPADRVHPGAVEAARRSGLELSKARPTRMDEVGSDPAQVVTVCDRAHEELPRDASWWHRSIPDPVEAPSKAAFDDTLARLWKRIEAVIGKG